MKQELIIRKNECEQIKIDTDRKWIKLGKTDIERKNDKIENVENHLNSENYQTSTKKK